MIDFPTSPTVGMIVTSPNGNQWRWDGTTWQLMRSVGVQAPDTRGFTFYQDATPTSVRAGDTWYHPSTGGQYVWTGSAWITYAASANAIAAIDTKATNEVNRQNQQVRGRWTSSAQSYGGTNAPVYLHATVFAVGCYASGYYWYTGVAGVYHMTYSLTINTSVAGFFASWIQRQADGSRWGSDTTPTNTTQGQIVSGAAVVQCNAGEAWSVNVYTNAPPTMDAMVVDMIMVQPA